MKLRVESRGAYVYPDKMVTYGTDDAGQSQFKREPLLLVEVLSPTTAAFDRGERVAAYRSLAPLR
ncbi:MAG: Uma2 family endonuclease [Pseudomonadota bacterium]|nr:Uma2 family endonuclease [Pseudomonadota bacterium]